MLLSGFGGILGPGYAVAQNPPDAPRDAAIKAHFPPDVIEAAGSEDLGQDIRARLVEHGQTAADEVMLTVSAEAQHLLRSAADAIDRRDWKVAIDALQRIIEQHGGELLQADANLYESARRYVQRLFAELPPEGLAAYRLLYDAEAGALLERARRDHDLDALREVVDRYLLTSVGDDAADLLASWLIDAGRPVEALALLHDVEQLHPASDIPPAVLRAKRAIALAMTGDPSGADDATVTSALASARSPVPHSWHDDVLDLTRSAAGRVEPAVGTLGGDWPALMGGGRCLGRMPGLQPRLMGIREWRSWLGEQTVRPPEEEGSRLPLAYGVIADERLIVRTRTQLVGYDVETMQRAWQTVPSVDLPGPDAAEQNQQQVVIQLPDGSTQAVEAARLDQLSQLAAVVGGLAYYIDPWGSSVLTRADAVSSASGGDDAERAIGPPPVRANRLVAYDPVRGRPVWSRGRSSSPGDPLAHVTFRSMPVSDGDSIVSLYQRPGGLLIGRLDPGDGRLLAERSLCGAPQRRWSPRQCLMMTAADGLIFVPTHRGCFLAVDAHDLSIRWACRYAERDAGKPAQPSWLASSLRELQAGWLMCPPVATGRTVLLAATDVDQLLAFDQQTGHILWRLNRQRFRYVAGAGQDTVWLVGDRAAAVDIATGKERWSVRIDGLSGRAALSGDRLYLPTGHGLVALSAETGDRLATFTLPAGQMPLGNLLCWSGALLSVDEQQVRKYPDLDEWYARARDALVGDNENASLAIRVAWLELLRGDPSAALAALDALPVRALTDVLRRAHVDHLRVRCLLELAEAARDDLDRSEAHLQRAAEIAATPAERTQTSLALARLAARRGNAAEAIMRYVRLAESYADLPARGDGSEARLVPVSDGSERHLYDIVREQVAGLQARLGEDESAALRAALADRLHEAADRRDYAAMEIYAETALPYGLGQKAGLQLGRWEVEDERYEVAAGRFSDVLAIDHRSAEAARAMSELGALYVRPVLDSPLTAAALAERLATEFPAERAQAAWPTKLRPEELAQRRAARDEAEYQVPVKQLWSVPYDTPRRLTIEGELPELLERRLLLATDDGRLVCDSLVDGEPLWEGSLRLDRGRSWLEQPYELTRFFQWEVPAAPTVPAVSAACDGLILVVRGEDGLHAFGAATGRAIWFRSILGAPESPTASPAGRLAYENGLLAFVPRPGVLEVARAATGRTTWRREVRPSETASLLLADGRLLTLSEDLRRVHVFDAISGASGLTLNFDQPLTSDVKGQPSEPLDLVVFGDVICGPDGAAVLGYDLQSGERLWRHDTRQKLTRLFDASSGVLGVGADKGQVEFIDPRSGKALLQVPPGSVFETFHDGAISEGVAVVAGESERGDFVIAGIDVDTGKRLWGPAKSPGKRVEMFEGWLIDSPRLFGLIYAVKREYRLGMYDKRTADLVSGAPWRIPVPPERGTGPWLQWFPGRAVVSNGRNWWVFATAPPEKPGEQM